MGLDMYLHAKKYVSGWNFERDNEEKVAEFNAIKEAIGVEPDKGSPSYNVEVTIGYWRKANAIHGWFVRELADGRDECQAIYVSRENLETLKSECLSALANRNKELVTSGVSLGDTRQTINIDMETVNVGQAISDMMTLQSHMSEFNDPDDTDPLRPVSGFFFGSAQKDEYYYQDLEETVEIVDKCLALDGRWSFEYQASW